MRYRALLLASLPLLACVAERRPAAAQTLAQRAAQAPDGVVRMSFPARPNVCGYGNAILFRDPNGGGDDRVTMFRGDADDIEEVKRNCVYGPVRVQVTVRGQQVERVRTRVGVPFGDTGERVTDLGTVAAAEAVDYLIGLASRARNGVGDEALFPTTLAAGVDVAPRLLRLAADEQVAAKTREKAVFWAAEAGAPVAELARVYQGTTSSQVREQVVFAYYRVRDPAATRELLRIARGSDAVEVRKKAVFWLGQKAGREITKELGDLVESGSADESVKEHAIFALSQRPRDEGIPALIQIARNNPDAKLRKRALFWLGQSGDPRAIDLFEEILTRR